MPHAHLFDILLEVGRHPYCLALLGVVTLELFVGLDVAEVLLTHAHLSDCGFKLLLVLASFVVTPASQDVVSAERTVFVLTG